MIKRILKNKLIKNVLFYGMSVFSIFIFGVVIINAAEREVVASYSCPGESGCSVNSESRAPNSPSLSVTMSCVDGEVEASYSFAYSGRYSSKYWFTGYGGQGSFGNHSGSQSGSYSQSVPLNRSYSVTYRVYCDNTNSDPPICNSSGSSNLATINFTVPAVTSSQCSTPPGPSETLPTASIRAKRASSSTYGTSNITVQSNSSENFNIRGTCTDSSSARLYKNGNSIASYSFSNTSDPNSVEHGVSVSANSSDSFYLQCSNIAGTPANSSTITLAVTPPPQSGTIYVIHSGGSSISSAVYSVSPDNSSTGSSMTGASINRGQTSSFTVTPGSYSISANNVSGHNKSLNPSSGTLTNGGSLTFNISYSAVALCSINLNSNGASSLTAEPGSVVPFSWSSSNVSGGITSSWGGTRGTSGSENRTMPSSTGTYTYSMSAQNSSGQSCASNTLTVNVAQAPPATASVTVQTDTADTRYTLSGGTQTPTPTNRRTLSSSGSSYTHTFYPASNGLSRVIVSPDHKAGYSVGVYDSIGNPAPYISPNESVTMYIDYDAGSPSCSLNGPSSVVEDTSMTLSWSSSNMVNSLSASNSWSGSKALSGSQTLTAPSVSSGQSQNYTYTLSGSNVENRGSSCSKTIEITKKPSTTAEITTTSNLSNTSYTIIDNRGGSVASGNTSTSGNTKTVTTTSFTNPVYVRAGSKSGYSSSVSPSSQNISAGGAYSFSVTYSDIPAVIRLNSNRNTSARLSRTDLSNSTTNHQLVSGRTENVSVTPGPSSKTYALTADDITGYSKSISSNPSNGRVSNGGTLTFDVEYTPTACSISMSSDKSTVKTGESIVLSWSSTNTSGVLRASGVNGWSGNKALNKSSGETLTVPTTSGVYSYALRGETSIGQACSATADVTVNDKTATITVSSNTTTTISVSPDTTNGASMTSDSVSGGGSNTYTAILASDPKSFTISVPSKSGYQSPVVVAKRGGVTVGSTSGTVSDGETLSFDIVYNELADATMNFSASPTSVPYRGATTLSWSTTNAESCGASGDWTGNKPTNGSQGFNNLRSSASYTLTCTSIKDGSPIAKNVTVTVGARPPECSNGIDDDSDSLTDLADPDCENSNDDSESGSFGLQQCRDGLDNDGDGLGDMQDPDCDNPTDNTESGSIGAFQCNDRVDNDSDGRIDLSDPDCSGPTDDSEYDDPTISFSASPSRIAPGGTTSLIWNNTSVSTCRAFGGPWTGSWSGSSANSGNKQSGSVNSSPTVFTIQCDNIPGTESFTSNTSVTFLDPTFDMQQKGRMEFLGITGTSTPAIITISPQYNFASNVTLRVIGASSQLNGSQYTFSKGTLSSSEYSSGSQLRVYVNKSIQSGTYSITVEARGGGLTRTMNVPLYLDNLDNTKFEEF